MNNTISEAKQAFLQIRDLSKTHGYINIPIDVLNSLERLDCVSRSIWLIIFKTGYFNDGAATVTLQELSEKLLVSRTSLEKKIKSLTETGFLLKKNNFNAKNHQYMASTFYAILPAESLELIKMSPTRRECFADAGRYITEGLGKVNETCTPLEKVKNDADEKASQELRSRMASLEGATSTSLTAKAEMLALKAQLKAAQGTGEKNLAEKISTPSPSTWVRSPNGRETYNNIKKIDIKNNNTCIGENKPISSCSSALQKYRNTPTQIPKKIRDKITKAVSEAQNITLPDELLKEAEFAVSRCFTGKTLDHAANVFCKLLREGRWTTPIPMRKKYAADPILTKAEFSPISNMLANVYKATNSINY